MKKNEKPADQWTRSETKYWRRKGFLTDAYWEHYVRTVRRNVFRDEPRMYATRPMRCDVEYFLTQVADALKPRKEHKVGLNLGSYTYFPTSTGMTRWVASDGSKMKVKCFLEIFEWAERFVAQMVETHHPEDFIRDHVVFRKSMTQQEHEEAML